MVAEIRSERESEWAAMGRVDQPHVVHHERDQVTLLGILATGHDP